MFLTLLHLYQSQSGHRTELGYYDHPETDVHKPLAEWLHLFCVVVYLPALINSMHYYVLMKSHNLNLFTAVFRVLS